MPRKLRFEQEGAVYRWLPEELHMGSLHEVSRRVAASLRKTTDHKT
jgi:hypothetical protein